MIVKRQFNNAHGETDFVTAECDKMIRHTEGGPEMVMLYKNGVLVDEFDLDEMRFVWVMEAGKTVDSIANRNAPPQTAGPAEVQKVRAKLRLVELNEEKRKIRLETMYDYNTPEDQQFCEATPWGELEFGIDNPLALAFFKEAEEFYVDFHAIKQ